MKEPEWVSRRVLLLLHSESLAEHGGLPGLRDEGLLDSALARPFNAFAYRDRCDLADLAASYAYGISSNHPFRDGNKRAAALAAGLFLELNGERCTADPLDLVEMFYGVAAGKISEKELAAWFRKNSERYE
jgi:death-on-curing protein